MRDMLGRMGKLLIYIVDMLLVRLSLECALLFRFEGVVPEGYRALANRSILFLIAIVLGTFWMCGLYKSLWRYASTRELGQIVMACLITNLLFVMMNFGMEQSFPKSIYFIFPLLLMAGVAGSRLGYRALRRLLRLGEKEYNVRKLQRTGKGVKRIMLIGAGDAAALLIREMTSDKMGRYKVVLCVDDSVRKVGQHLMGVPVRGTTEHLAMLAKRYEIDEIIVAMPSASKKRISEILQQCSETPCKLRIFPGIKGILQKPQQGVSLVRDVKVEDLLGREEIILHNEKVSKIIKGKTVLVTGGGGSIGSELCRQIIKLAPSRLLILDIYENNAYDLQMELLQSGIPREQLVVLIGSVRDQSKLEEVFSTYQPDIVFHAAAHKHVPLMEHNPGDAIKNNVFGTYNVAQCARRFACEKFVLVSTDKAVNPTNVMGATKRICEMIVQAMNGVTDTTEFVAVRFGNVLGSNGSVIPLFRKQLSAGGPLTVTHPDIIRYFMTIPEAVRLILEASSMAKGGEIFVLDMGEPVKIYDLAKNFIKLSGLEEGKDVEIAFTGLRPGEKLYEELLMEEEGLDRTDSEKIFIGKPTGVSYGELMAHLNRLDNAVRENEDLREALMDVVPTYKIPTYNQQVV